MEALSKYDEDMKDWRIRFDFVNQKLFKLINNIESRIILIEFIKSTIVCIITFCILILIPFSSVLSNNHILFVTNKQLK